ncbi:Apical endosomal glycoprotein [Actinidia chinensis var. chinensis]|uniref:Apical endosomal glycoprotein n=1 Tax=Actinidia chinensis var. chinensis TaxID=1590841 RepID=A0A2R6QMW1_ACTCC|nr:Apical endosomal glycoprotein [Actinidia chinensis var. chinensis]
MNSIFSSFDAVCAEFLGQSIKASLPGRLQSNQLSRELKDTVNNSSPPPPASSYTRSRPQQQKAAARFAPELDGLFCFETLVSY